MTYEVLRTLPEHFLDIDLREMLWPLTEAGPEVFRQIQNDIRFLRYSRIVAALLTLIIFLFCVPISGDIREVLCILYLLDDINQRIWYPYLVFLVFIVKFYCGMTFPNPLFMLFVKVGDTIYALMILREKMRSIATRASVEDILYEDKAYQKFVERALIRGINEHITIRRYNQQNHELIQRNLVIIFLVSVLIFGIVCYNMNTSSSVLTLMKYSFICSSFIFYFYLFIVTGQSLEDESEALHRDLCDCPWYLWNKSNRMLYLMFLIHSREPLTVRSIGIQLDNSILVRVAKLTMSILTALQRLTS